MTRRERGVPPRVEALEGLRKIRLNDPQAIPNRGQSPAPMLRPCRATGARDWLSQGVALGCHVSAFQDNPRGIKDFLDRGA